MRRCYSQTAYGGARYNRERTILTEPITVNGESCSVVGVLPFGFWFQQDAQMFMPVRVAASPRDLGHYYNLLARLKPGVTATQATNELESLFPQFRSWLTAILSMTAKSYFLCEQLSGRSSWQCAAGIVGTFWSGLPSITDILRQCRAFADRAGSNPT